MSRNGKTSPFASPTKKEAHQNSPVSPLIVQIHRLTQPSASSPSPSPTVPAYSSPPTARIAGLKIETQSPSPPGIKSAVLSPDSPSRLSATRPDLSKSPPSSLRTSSPDVTNKTYRVSQQGTLGLSRNSETSPALQAFPSFDRQPQLSNLNTSLTGIAHGPPSVASSRRSSRRPSLVSTSSFLEGVSHVARVRSPSLRGHSRHPSLESSPSYINIGEAISNGGIPMQIPGNRYDDFAMGDESVKTTTFFTPETFKQEHVIPRPPFARSDSASSKQSLVSPKLTSRPSIVSRPSFASSRAPSMLSDSRFFVFDEDEELDETFRQDMVDFSGFGPIDEGPYYNDGFLQEEDLQVLSEGDRFGLGTVHEGYPLVDALSTGYDTIGDDIQYEVVRQLGYGSYAVVYLIRQILYEPSTSGGNSTLFDVEGTRRDSIVYGQEFALKCLCKRNLSEDLLAVQKFEATLHQSLPPHPNIVALHRALETPAWLFLVLEYCPGQDLFYWLEQARDHEDLDGPSRPLSRLNSIAGPLNSYENGNGHINGNSSPLNSPDLPNTSFDNTPPSPSLLATTADTSMLSRRRLRLISRMFVQMCEGLQACHDVGVSHRDIKPENIIIADLRDGDDRKITVKLTDWGLGSSSDYCEEFDCGSKPYMAYECRNNVTPRYEPKAADVWSLGIVLLNLLFHRCPWADPTPEDADFASFQRNPIEFLENRFQGIGRTTAKFLSERVFCNVLDGKNKRATAGEFGRWASMLVRHMGEGNHRASISEATKALHSSSARPSARMEYERRFSSIMHTPDRSPRQSVDYSPRAVHASPRTRPSSKQYDHSFLPNDLQAVLEQVPQELPHTNGVNGTNGMNGLVPPTISVSHELGSMSEGEAVGHNRHRRRKRGARRTRQPSDASSPTSPTSSHARNGDTLEQASHTVEQLARELSSAKKGEPEPVKKKPSRLMDKFKRSFMKGNADLAAFTQSVKERDARIGANFDTISAPAKMQQTRHQNSTASYNSFGTSSWNSIGSDESDRGRGVGSHWASMSERRQRVEKRAHRREHTAEP